MADKTCDLLNEVGRLEFLTSKYTKGAPVIMMARTSDERTTQLFDPIIHGLGSKDGEGMWQLVSARGSGVDARETRLPQDSVPVGCRDAWRVRPVVVGTEPPAGKATHGEAKSDGLVVNNLEKEQVASWLQERSHVLERVLQVGGSVQYVGSNDNLTSLVSGLRWVSPC